MDDALDWTGPLCADDIVRLTEARVEGGTILPGSRVTFDSLEQGAGKGEVIDLAAGFKGRAPFRKRLWVTALVRLDDGTTRRILAPELRAEAPSPGEAD
jgi:hypothetical protein